jgi:hypothetical protein
MPDDPNTAVLAAIAALDTSLGARIDAVSDALRQEITAVRSTVMDRMDRLQTTIDATSHAVSVNLRADEQVRGKMHALTSDNTFMLEQIIDLQQQILKLTARLEAVEGKHD